VTTLRRRRRGTTLCNGFFSKCFAGNRAGEAEFRIGALASFRQRVKIREVDKVKVVPFAFAFWCILHRFVFGVSLNVGWEELRG